MTEPTPLIEVVGVEKRFGPITAVGGVSFSIQRGEVVGFLGPNGAGKTTTMRLLAGFYRPDVGRVRIDGLDTQEHDLRVKRTIGYLPENNPLYADMPVAEQIELTADLRGIPKTNRRTAVDRVVEETGLEAVFYRPVGQLSKGFRQRVGLALAILHEPDVLILDEPTEGLDPNQRVEIRELIKELGKVHTVLLSTHVMQEVEHTCQRLLVMHRGLLVADSPVDALLKQAHGARVVRVEMSGGDGIEALQGLEGVDHVDVEESVEGRQRYALTVSGEGDVRPQVFALAASRGWVLWELHEEPPKLEEIFHALTRDP
ncbi:MAG: ATP-binding cassette domain-containing protein [Chloroflexi bacterium]|nr:ATP-binding cassette domain-containing protein [Chloroflexota bacterium]